ncbi:hypothetical protein [Brevibacillus panacihumi]|uniref:hypothetical protein n=1 Tax=Brevibacillus panacihumi TaxID=497735 RepID=UPI003D24717C
MSQKEIEVGVRLGEVIAGHRAFNPADHGPIRQVIAEFKREGNPYTSFVGRKLDELYRCAKRLDQLRKTQPEHSRPIRREKAEAVRLMEAMGRAQGRMIAEYARREGAVNGV